LDIQEFFDSVDHDLMVKAVEANTDQPWVVLYVKRWLSAPIQQADGSLHERDCGTPQGSAVSPVLANLFLHYAFDMWMERTFPNVRFERYVDDAVVHCRTRQHAEMLREAIGRRMVEVGLPGLVVVAIAARYKGYRYPIEVIGHAVWLYHRFALSLCRLPG
jgi:RNA-directed DNA polymerase